MTWKGWEDFVPQTRADAGSSTAKTLMKSARADKNIGDSARAPHASSTGRKSKYGAVPTVVDGHRFASQREAARYLVLVDQQQRGVITNLELQPQFPLTVTTPTGIRTAIGRYIADFRYVLNGKVVIEDSKGYSKDKTYVWKKKHVEMEHGIVILET